MPHCPVALRESIAHYLATLDYHALSYAGMMRNGMDVESVYSSVSPWRYFASRLYVDVPWTSEPGIVVGVFDKSWLDRLKYMIPEPPSNEP